MKLIDLLVQELPKRGGWPKKTNDILALRTFMVEHNIEFNATHGGEWFNDAGFGAVNSVSKDKYEAALAASKQVAWDGRGLPPVGLLCEFFNGGRYDCRDSVPKDGTEVKIVAHDKSEIGVDTAVFTWHGTDGAIHAEVCTEMLFRPIRTEAERKREDSIHGIASFAISYRDAAEIYDAIAAGKIPGIKLDD